MRDKDWSASDLSSFLQEVLDATMELQGADFGDVQFYDEATRTLRIIAHRGVSNEFLRYFESVDASDTSACGLALRAGTRIIIEDVNAHPDYQPHQAIAASTGYRGVQSTPLFERGTGKPVGVLSTLFRQPYRPSEHELRLSDLCARQAADVISSWLAEQRLRDREEQLRVALAAGGMGTWEWDTETNLLMADAIQRSFFGLSPDEGPLPVEIYWQQMMPEEVDRALKAAHSALRTGRAFQNEQRVRRPDGQIVWLLSRGQARHSDPKRVVGISLDITERRRSESALRQSEGRLSAILNQLPGAVGLFNLEGKPLLRVGTLSRLWDDVIPSATPTSVRGWRGFDAMGGLLSPSQYPGARALRGETVAPGPDFLHTADDGHETWISVSAAPFRDETGRIVGAVSILQNVDDVKRAEQRLRESEARLQAAVDLVKLARYSWNPQTNVLQWDGALRAMWGLPADAAVDYDVFRAGVHPDDLARVEAAIRQCADPQGDGVYDIEYRVIGLTDGVERWIATRGQTNFDGVKPVSFYGVALDITEQKRVENMLEARVEARTRELEAVNRQLRAQIEQRQMAEATVQKLQRLDAIGQITSGVAHDFNNLLSVVLANSRLLARNVTDPDDQESVALIRAAAERGAKLTSQLLAFSRRQRLEPESVDINRRIRGMKGLLGVTSGGTVQLRTILADHLSLALVDPTQIELIVLNLAINARDAMPSGGTLTLETLNATVDSEPTRPEEPSRGEYVALVVRDTGTGIPDKMLHRVFEPFFTTKQPGKGSGLGLAQVFGVAKQSGGGVRIDTSVGKGTSVTVFFPRAPEPARKPGGQPEGRTDRPLSGNSTVLVVDDDMIVLKSTRRMLDLLGYNVITAESGTEALRLVVSGGAIDLVLADFAMPEMNGVDLARAIRSARPTLPLVLVTGQGNLDTVKGLGEFRLLQKPYSEDEVVATISAALRDRG